MGDVVGCSVVHRLPAAFGVSLTPTVATSIATAAVAAASSTSTGTPALPSKIDRMVPFGVGRELRRRVRRKRVAVRHRRGAKPNAIYRNARRVQHDHSADAVWYRNWHHLRQPVYWIVGLVVSTVQASSGGLRKDTKHRQPTAHVWRDSYRVLSNLLVRHFLSALATAAAASLAAAHATAISTTPDLAIFGRTVHRCLFRRRSPRILPRLQPERVDPGTLRRERRCVLRFDVRPPSSVTLGPVGSLRGRTELRK